MKKQSWRSNRISAALALMVLPAVLAGACSESSPDHVTAAASGGSGSGGSGGDPNAIVPTATGGAGGGAPNVPKAGTGGDLTGCKETWNLLCEKACACGPKCTFDHGGLATDMMSLSTCESFVTTYDSCNADPTFRSVNWPACAAALPQASCTQSTGGPGIAVPADCELK